MRQSMGKRLGGNKQLLMDDADLRKLRDANFLYHSAHNRAMVFNMSFEGSCSVCLPVCVCVWSSVMLFSSWELRSGARGCDGRPSVMEASTEASQVPRLA